MFQLLYVKTNLINLYSSLFLVYTFLRVRFMFYVILSSFTLFLVHVRSLEGCGSDSKRFPLLYVKERQAEGFFLSFFRFSARVSCPGSVSRVVQVCRVAWQVCRRGRRAD